MLVQADAEAYMLPEVALRLVRTLAAHAEISLLVPVTNEPWSEEARATPPFLYSTPTLLAEAAAAVAAAAGPPRAASAPRSPVFAIRREALRAIGERLPDLPLR